MNSDAPRTTPPGSLTESERQALNSAFVKLRFADRKVELWPHEATALYNEIARLSNYATLLGEASPAEQAGIFTREECEQIARADASEHQATPPRGSIGNPLTDADMPFTVPKDGCYWIKLASQELTQLPFSPAGAVLAAEVKRDV